MTFESRGSLAVWTWPSFDALAGVEAVVTTRAGGVSEGPYSSLNLALHVGDDPALVMENRRRAAGAVGLALEQLVFCGQPHGAVVTQVGRDDGGGVAATMADGLVTGDEGVGLVVMVADCVPVVLFDPVTRTLACVHAGWRGTVAGVVGAAVAAMVARGARASDVVAGLGPAIEARRYQVGAEVRAAAGAAGLSEFADADADADAVADGAGDGAGVGAAADVAGRWTFDLWGANRRVLEAAGVAPSKVTVADVGTESGTFFYSDRRERPCGRFAVVARLS